MSYKKLHFAIIFIVKLELWKNEWGKAACIATNILSPWYPHPMPRDILQNSTPPTETSSVAHLSSNANDNGYRRSPPERPTTMPYPPTEDNVPALRQYLLDKFKNSAFDKSAPFPILDSKPGHIFLKPDAIPHACHTFIPVPHHWKDEVKERLNDYRVRVRVRVRVYFFCHMKL